MKSQADRLPKGRSYPLKPTMLAGAIDAAGLNLPLKLTRWDRFESGLTARFYPDGAWAGEDGEMIWVCCRAVPSDHASAIRAAILGVGIPRLIDWAKAIEALDVRSTVRREQQAFVYPYPDPES
jgi:hypothetical protein